MTNLETRDIGILIRDRLEDDTVCSHREHDGDLIEDGEEEIEFIDVSDPDNLVIFVSNGQTFTVRIIAGGRP